MKIYQGVTLISNGRLVIGRGAPPVPDGLVIVRDGKIAYAGPVLGAPEVPPDVRRIDAQGGTILPGLVEAPVPDPGRHGPRRDARGHARRRC